MKLNVAQIIANDAQAIAYSINIIKIKFINHSSVSFRTYVINKWHLIKYFENIYLVTDNNKWNLTTILGNDM